MLTYQPDPDFARHLDETDPLRPYRARFLLPRHPAGGHPLIYFCGHSLGLQPAAVRSMIERELAGWEALGVEGHFKSRDPWYAYHELFRDRLAHLVGAQPGEAVAMNSLTVNLHLMLTTFYRPTAERFRILLEEPIFPSDRYAVGSHLRCRDVDPVRGLLTISPRAGEHTIDTEHIEQLLTERGAEIAVVLLNGVNFFTGQRFDLERITAAAHRQGCVVGFDLAHAVGNVPLRLHEWQVDFAVWCSYKYLNSGPGAIGGCFVHEKHGKDLDLPRLAGWWGNDPAQRFRMPSDFVPQPGADGWQVSNPSILAMVPLRASLDLFDQAGMATLRLKSEALTGYLQFLLDRLPANRFTVITPRAPAERGCQLSILVHDQPRALVAALQNAGVVCDFREPNVIRVAPVPLYNTFEEVWRFAQILAQS